MAMDADDAMERVGIFLSQTGIDDGHILDWSMTLKDGVTVQPEQIELDDDYDPFSIDCVPALEIGAGTTVPEPVIKAMLRVLEEYRVAIPSNRDFMQRLGLAATIAGMLAAKATGEDEEAA